MHRFLRGSLAALLAFGAFGAAQARPVVVEEKLILRTPDDTYTSFGGAVGIDGDHAIVSATREVADPDGNRARDEIFDNAYLYRRVGTAWTLVRALGEQRQYRIYYHEPAIAMQRGIAAVQTGGLDFYELTAGDWIRSPSSIEREAPGIDIEIDAGTVIQGDGFCSWDGLIFHKDPASATWVNAARLIGNYKGCDDEFRGGPVDISGDWAVVHQPYSEDHPDPHALIFRNYGGTSGWYTMGYGAAERPAEATTFGPEVAIRDGDVLVGGSNESGTYVFREDPGYGFREAGRMQSLDSFMGAGPAGAFEKSELFVLQHSWNNDRGASVINVFRRNAADGYDHVAVLAGKNGASLGSAIAISGRRVLAGGNNRVHYFELPDSLTPPAVLQDNFESGSASGWAAQTTGSQFVIAQNGNTRVLRQQSIDGDARTVLNGSDWNSVAIEADIRATEFAGADSWIGLATRYQSPLNHYYVALRANGRVELRRVASGTTRTLASAAFTVSNTRTYRVRLEAIGTLHRVYIDGALLLDVDSSGPTRGRAALFSYRARGDFDNVVVSPSPLTTIYSTGFENSTAGPWKHSGRGFWNLWESASTVYYQSSIADFARATIGVATDDLSVRLRARLDTFASPNGTQERWFGVMTRYVDDGNHYYLALRNNNTVVLRKVVNGVVSTLASAAFTVAPMSWHTLRLDAVDNQLRAYANGRLVLQATDSSHARGTSGPVTFKTAADFDDFVVYQP